MEKITFLKKGTNEHIDQTWALMTIEKVGKTMDSKIENFEKKKKKGEREGEWKTIF